MLKYGFLGVIIIAICLSILNTNPVRVLAQAIPTSLPTTAPTSVATTFTTTAPTSAPTSYTTSIPAYQTSVPMLVPTTVPTTYATTAPTTKPTVLPGTPPPTTAFLGGCQIFPKNDLVYNTQIYSLPVDVNNNALMTSYLAAQPISTTAPHLNLSTQLNYSQINFATNNTPQYPLITNTGVAIEGITNFPFDSNFEWQEKDAPRTGDHHLMVLNTDTCQEYEAYNSAIEPPYSYSVINGQLQNNTNANSYGHKWDLTQPYPTSVAGAVDAGYMPYFAGMIRWEDWLSGCICHALNIDVLSHSLRGNSYVYPAMKPETVGYYTGPLQYASTALPLGAHLRLNQSFTLSCVCPESQLVVKTLKVFGAFVMDTGCCAGTLYFTSYYNNGGWTFPWDLADLDNLWKVPLSSFEVVPPPTCSSVESCIK